MRFQKIALLIGIGLLLTQPAQAMTASLGDMGWWLFMMGVGIPAVITGVVTLVKVGVRPQLPSRWLKTFLLAWLTWLGSLWLLYSLGNSSNHERATIDFWSFATIFISPLLTLGVAILVTFRAKPNKPAEPVR